MAALEMPGCSLSLLPLDATRRALLEAPSAVRAWPCSAQIGTGKTVTLPQKPVQSLTAVLKAGVARVAMALTEAEPHLADLDSRAGDGDLGASMFRAAEALRTLPEAAYNDPATLMSSA